MPGKGTLPSLLVNNIKIDCFASFQFRISLPKDSPELFTVLFNLLLGWRPVISIPTEIKKGEYYVINSTLIKQINGFFNPILSGYAPVP